MNGLKQPCESTQVYTFLDLHGFARVLPFLLVLRVCCSLLRVKRCFFLGQQSGAKEIHVQLLHL